MASLTITRATGEVSTHEITPLMEVAFESYFQGGLVELYTKNEKQTYKYWLAHFAWKEAKLEPLAPPFGDEFLKLLKKVKIDFGDEPNPNG
jgi:hypothetical protein